MSIFNEIKKISKKYPDKIALIVGNNQYTYSELIKDVEAVSMFFINLKIKSKDKVGVIENNTIEFILIFLALSNIGAIIIPLSTSYTKKMIYDNFINLKIDHLILWYKYLNYFKNKKLNLKNLITTDKKIKNVTFFNDYKNFKYAKKKINFKKHYNNFLICLTSGSTNKPKPIVLSQKTKILRSIAARKLYKINNNDTVLTPSPLDHTLGQRIFLLPLLAGGTSVVLKVFTIFNFYEAIKKYDVSFTILVPNQISEIVKNRNEFKNFYIKKGIVSASSKLSSNLKNKLIRNKIKIYEMYGASEIGTATSICLNTDKDKFKSVGKQYDNIKVKVLSKQEKFLQKHKVGEIVCKTPYIFSKYYKLNKETKDSFYKNYFKTGDIGYIDEKNYLYYLGRKKNIIKVSGNMVYAEDVENLILRNKNISEAIVFGLSDKQDLEKIVLCVIPKKKDYSKENLQLYCQKNLASFQQPSNILFFNSFSKTNLGKLDRPKIKKEILKKL